MNLTAFPTELLEQIVSHLDYNSAKNLHSAISESQLYLGGNVDYVGLRKVCDERLSVRHYVDRNFGDTKALFTAMSKNYTYLSGSRSLEFFVPGTVTDESDWDFYIPMNLAYIGNFMQALESMDVKWMSYEDELAWKLKHYTTPFTIERVKLFHIAGSGEMRRAVVRCGLNIGDQDELELTEYYKISIEQLNVRITPCDISEMEYPGTSGYRVASGLLARGPRVTLVQLMGERRPYGDSYIHSTFSYHSSCVQSFISPYVSCHLYGSMTCNGITHGWRDHIDDESEQNVCRLEPGSHIDTSGVPKWNKYALRGFKYIDPLGSYLELKIRKPTDELSIWIEHDYDIGAGTDVKNMYQRSYANMIWHEKPYGPHPLYPHVYDLYGYSELSVDHWVTSKYCSDSERKGLEYLPAGVDYIMRPVH